MKYKIGFIVLLLPIALFAIIVGGRVPYFLLYSLLTLMVLPLIHSLLGICTIRGQVKVQEGEIYAGDTIDIDYKIWTRPFLSLPKVKVENNIAHNLTGQKSFLEAFSLFGGQNYSNNIRVNCNRRGDYDIGYIKVIVGDIFNFFSLSKRIYTPFRLRVYPKIVPLYRLPLKAIIPMGEISINNQLLQDFTELSDLKPYQQGDSIKKIHWKSSAKQDELLVKNFQPKGDTHVTIFPNSSSKDYINDRDKQIEDQVVEIALSIANHCLNNDVKVSLSYEKQEKRVHIEGNYLSDIKKFMEELVSFQPKESTDFSSQIIKYSTMFSQGATTIFITPAIDKDLAAQSIHWKMRGINPVYILLENNRESRISEGTQLIMKKLRDEGIQVYQLTNIEELGIGLGDKNERSI